MIMTLSMIASRILLPYVSLVSLLFLFDSFSLWSEAPSVTYFFLVQGEQTMKNFILEKNNEAVLVCTTKRSARFQKFNVREEYREVHLEDNNKAVNRKVILWQPLQPEI